MKILYVENHSVFATNVIGQFLSQHSVVVVPSIAEARRAVAVQEFDLLLIDFDLDDGKGDVLVREVRSSYPSMVIVGVSSHDFGNEQLLKSGASAICGKMQFDRIQEVIEKAFAGNGRSSIRER